MFALEAVDLDALRADIMSRLEHHRDRQARYERILAKRFPDGTAPHADLGKLLNLRLGVRHERAVVEWCEEALDLLAGGKAASAVAVAKAKAGTTATRAVQEGVQMHGGMGMADQFDIGFFMKRARVCEELFGDANFHADQLARSRSY
ncbi:hypothetical protein KXV85_003970 [Aspergillus fumigatus]|nr:hypothetical protein KXV85_003970 [Aspergillus fumigatus]